MRFPSVSLTAGILSLASVPLLSAETPEPKFRAVTIDPAIQIGYGVAVADIDGDKKPDIVLCDKNQIVWYQNPGWQKHVIAENLTKLDHVCIAVRDIDGDGKAEIAVGAGWNPSDTVNSGGLFYLISPKDRTQRWEPVTLPHDPTIHRIRWARTWQNAFSLISVPLHGRGNNAAKGEGDGVKITRLTPPTDPRGEWKTEVLNNEWHKTHNFDPVNWDDDIADELLVGSKEGAFVLNWSQEKNGYVTEQLADGENGGFGEIRLGKLAAGARFVAGVSPMHGNTAVVLTPPTSGAGLWKRTVIDEGIVDGHAVACGDLLRTGSDQIVVGWRAMSRPGAKVGIKLYTEIDSGSGKWRATLVDDNTMACEDLCLADLDGDGKLDIVAAGRGTKNVKVYFNDTK